MDKVDIIRKHIGNDDFYDMNGTPLLTKILAAMNEYAQQQVKNCSIPAVSVSLERAKKYGRHQHYLGTQNKPLVEWKEWEAKD